MPVYLVFLALGFKGELNEAVLMYNVIHHLNVVK